MQWEDEGNWQGPFVPCDFSPLHTLLSGENCSTDKIQQLLDRGIPVNSLMHEAPSPLHMAVWNPNCSLDVVRCLLDNGADVNARAREYKFPLHYLFEFSTDNGRAIDIATLLLERGCHVNATDISGRTPLHYALRTGLSKDLVELMLNHGASVDETDGAQCTPLHVAIRNEMVPLDTIKLLLDRRPKDQRDDDERANELHYIFLMSLHVAAEKRDPEIVQLLLDYGARLNFTNFEDKSPLLVAACHNTTEVTKALLDAGALVSCGKSPIKEVLRKYDVSVNKVALRNVQLLLKYALLEDAVLHSDCTCNLFGRCVITEELMQFWKDCLKEIHEMQNVHVNPGISLTQHIFHLRFQKMHKTKEEMKGITDMLLCHISPKSFPLYNEVISGVIRREYFLDVLENYRAAYTASNHSNPDSDVRNLVIFHDQVLPMMTERLSEVDLLNLVLSLNESWLLRKMK